MVLHGAHAPKNTMVYTDFDCQNDLIHSFCLESYAAYDESPRCAGPKGAVISAVPSRPRCREVELWMGDWHKLASDSW